MPQNVQLYLSVMVNYTCVLFLVVDPTRRREGNILWGLSFSSSRDSHKIEICSYLGIISPWWRMDTFCHREIKVLLIWLWHIQRSFLIFTPFVWKEFLSFIGEWSTFLAHHTSTRHHILPHMASITQQSSRKGQEVKKRNLPHNWQCVQTNSWGIRQVY